MKYGRQFAVWTLLWLIAAGWVGWLMTQPVPEAWLRKHARGLGFVRTYTRVAPALLRWQSIPTLPTNTAGIARAVVLHPSAYLAESDMAKLQERYAPAGIERYVQRLKTILLSPASAVMKQQATEDPFNLGALLDDLLSPALTSRAPALYVFTFGDTLDAALLNAEAVYRLLDGLQSEGALGPCQGICSFLSSPQQQTARHQLFIQALDTFEWLTTFERALDREGIDRELLRPYITDMRALILSEPEPERAQAQLQRLADAGLQPVVRCFLERHAEGFICTHRVLPAAGQSIAQARARVHALLDENYIAAVALSPQTFAAQYRLLLRLLLLGIGVLWALGIAVALLQSSIRRALTRVVLGEDPDTRVSEFMVARGFARYFGGCGLKSFGDFMMLGVPDRAGVKFPPVTTAFHTVAGAQLRSDEITLPVTDAAPAFCRREGGCMLRVIRGRGRAAAVVAAHARAFLSLRGRGVLTLPLVACGAAEWHGRRHAFYVLVLRPGYTPLAALQDERAGLEGWWGPGHPAELMHAVGDIMRACARLGLYGHEPGPGWIVTRRTTSGGLRVRVAGFRPARRHGLLTRAARHLLPWLRYARMLKSITAVNRRLYPEYFTLRDRLRMYRRAMGRDRLTLFDKRLINQVMQHSLERGYANYCAPAGDLVVNPSLRDMLAATGAQSYATLAAVTGARRVTLKRNRTVVTLQAGGQRLYLKRHTGVSLLTALGRLIRHRRCLTEARLEWEAIECLASNGLRAVPVIAMGERVRWGFWERGSLLMTAELPGGESLEELLGRTPTLPLHVRVELAQRAGWLARRMHMAELVHRDFYLGHIYMVGDLRHGYRLHLLDLQRVMHGARMYNRWAVKDITSLHFSSIPVTVIHNSDRMRFLCAYLRIDTLDEQARRFAFRVLRKSTRVARHTEKLLERRRRRGELPACKSAPP